MGQERTPAARDAVIESGARQPPPQSREQSLEAQLPATPDEIGGPRGLEPTRYGDWERNGRCVDF